MTDVSDIELLRDYERKGSEEAFAELVRRHVSLVYSAAYRHVGNDAHSEEITQAVFIILARKAGKLRPDTILEGWLYETTRLTALSFLRGERRRQFREQEAYMQSTVQEGSDATVWNQLAPLLDEAMARLGKKDREAVVLRFFKEKSLDEVAAVMRVSEAAAQSRVHRAMEKLRKYFTKRGVMLTTVTIAGAIAANSVQAAPVGLAKSTTTVAIVKGAAVSASTLTLMKGALKVMAWTKMKTAAFVGIAVLLAVGATGVAVETVKKSTGPSIEDYFTRIDSDYLDTAPPKQLILRPSKYAGQGGSIVSGRNIQKGNQMRRGMPFSGILHLAYGFGPEKMIPLSDLPPGEFDLLLTAPNDTETLKKEIEKRFGLIAHPEKRVTDVLIMKNTNPNAPGLKISKSDWPSGSWPQPGVIKYTGYRMSHPIKYNVAGEIGLQANLPVIDETGLTNAYDIEFHWNANLQGDALKADIMRELNKQLGLVLIPDRREVEMLVVEKVK